MQYPKFPSEKAYSFRKDGKYLALAERRETKDYISIYDCETWAIVKYFPVDTNDLDGIAWSPDGRFIAVWENPLEVKGIFFFFKKSQIFRNLYLYKLTPILSTKS